MPHQFQAQIFKVGINPCVDVPRRVSRALGRSGYIPVAGTVNGAAFRSGLVSLGGGRHRLFINTRMRQAAGLDLGDRVEIVLDYDPAPRRQPLPDPLRLALMENPAARTAWEALRPSRRKEILTYLNSLKRPATVERNVEKLMRHLLEGE